MIGAELHVIGGKHSGQVIPLNRKKFLIGREQDCQLRPNSELVSRHHCVFSVDDFSVRLRDLGSTNGTRVNGERILKEVVLSAGDRIIVGSLEFTLKLNEAVDSDVVTTSQAANEDTVVASGGTLLEMDALQPATPEQAETPAGTPSPAATPPASGSDQTLGAGDTTVISQPAMLPGQQPYQPMMPQMGYGYPAPMYGGYPFQPQMPMYPGYPQPMMPPGMPGYPQQQPAMQQTGTAAATESAPQISLPDPSETGAKDDAPVKGSAGAQKGNMQQSTGAADAIIRKHQQRRPG
ncbi:MAG: FHA domain-containing protein [Planctomycetaceae bacterium]